MDNIVSGFPRQALSRTKKTKEWMKDCIRFADKNTVLSSSMLRKTLVHKQINYDLVGGKIHMSDLEIVVNPEGIDFGGKTKPIQHFPVMNDKLMLLLGEERASTFDPKVVVTNPNAISEVEEAKKQAIIASIQKTIEDESLSEEDYNAQMEKIRDFYTYSWQDLKEWRGNCLLNHYSKEQNFQEIFNDGFMDELTVMEEIYQCAIIGGEPILRKLNPLKVRVYGSTSSSKVEDADIVAIEDYFPLGRIIDTYKDFLTKSDIDYLENLYNKGNDGERGDREDPRNSFIFGEDFGGITFNGDDYTFADSISANDLPYDLMGNIRVLQVYWKSLRKIQEVKYYDPETGLQRFKYETEEYVCNPDLGEVATARWINEAWHGTMIGSGSNSIFVDMGPCQIQYNRLSNPSLCHFGIIGTIYGINEAAPYSLVDMMKPLAYAYDVAQDKLTKLINRNLGKVIQLNFSTMPKDFDTDKWLSYVKNCGLAVIDPMRESVSGHNKGKLGGMFNPAPVIDAELSGSIQNMIGYLEYLKNEMGELTGITKQRMGQIANRETANGVERSNIQSSHTTRYYFSKHDDTKKRVMECFLETAKIAALIASKNGKNMKFQYILPDQTKQIMDIDGEEFAECDYGIVIDNSFDTQSLKQDIDMMAQAAMQNQTINFSTYLKIKSDCSLANKIKMIEIDENKAREAQQQAQQQQMQQAQQQMEMQQQAAMQELQLKDGINQRDNQTKILVATLQAQAQMAQNQEEEEEPAEEDHSDLMEKMREFDETLNFKNKELELKKKQHDTDNATKLRIAASKPNNTKQ